MGSVAESSVDFATVEARKIVRAWLVEQSDERTLEALVADGVRAGYALGLGVNA